MARLLVSIVAAAAVLASVAEARPGCSEKEEDAMGESYQKCLNEVNEKSHKEMSKIKSNSDYQRIVCKLIKDTVDCVNLHAKCYSPAEIREDKDRHIAGRMQQFAKDDTVSVRKCPVVKEYQDSGRADVKASEDEKCTKGQVSEVHTAYQICSQEKGDAALSELQDEKDKRIVEVRKKSPNFDDEDSLLDTESDVKPVFCRALNKIDGECGVKLAKCFTKSDSDQMREAYVEQMKKYFAGMYEGLDLSECEIEEEGEDDADDENPFKISDSESDDPFADGADFDPFLDYPGESNDIGGDAAPSQRSTPDGADTSAATAEKTTSTTTKTTTTKVDGGAEKTYRAASVAGTSSADAIASATVALMFSLLASFLRR